VKDLTTPSSKVLGHDSYKGMGVDFGDLGQRGLTDIVVSNITSQFALQESNFVFMNTGRAQDLAHGLAPFVDRSEDMGLARSGWSWDVKLADLNNAGRLDMVQAVGFEQGTSNRWPQLQELAIANPELLQDPRIWPGFGPGTDLSGQEHNRFYVQGRDGRYYDVWPQLGLPQAGPSRSVALADVYGNGLLDMAIANQMADSSFYRNTSPGSGGYLGLNLLLPAGRTAWPAGVQVLPGHPAYRGAARAAIGARVTVHLADGRQVVTSVDGGNGHGGRRSPEIHVGLGQVAAATPVAVDVEWRDGAGLHHDRLRLLPGWHTLLLG
jgi:hypothetical protein